MMQSSDCIGRDEETLKQTDTASSCKPNWSEKPEYHSELCVLDSGANRYLVGGCRYFVEYPNLSPKEREKAIVHGHGGKTASVGVG